MAKTAEELRVLRKARLRELALAEAELEDVGKSTSLSLVRTGGPRPQKPTTYNDPSGTQYGRGVSVYWGPGSFPPDAGFSYGVYTCDSCGFKYAASMDWIKKGLHKVMDVIPKMWHKLGGKWSEWRRTRLTKKMNKVNDKIKDLSDKIKEHTSKAPGVDATEEKRKEHADKGKALADKKKALGTKHDDLKRYHAYHGDKITYHQNMSDAYKQPYDRRDFSKIQKPKVTPGPKAEPEEKAGSFGLWGGDPQVLEAAAGAIERLGSARFNSSDALVLTAFAEECCAACCPACGDVNLPSEIVDGEMVARDIYAIRTAAGEESFTCGSCGIEMRCASGDVFNNCLLCGDPVEKTSAFLQIVEDRVSIYACVNDMPPDTEADYHLYHCNACGFKYAAAALGGYWQRAKDVFHIVRHNLGKAYHGLRAALKQRKITHLTDKMNDHQGKLDSGWDSGEKGKGKELSQADKDQATSAISTLKENIDKHKTGLGHMTEMQGWHHQEIMKRTSPLESTLRKTETQKPVKPGKTAPATGTSSAPPAPTGAPEVVTAPLASYQVLASAADNFGRGLASPSEIEILAEFASGTASYCPACGDINLPISTLSQAEVYAMMKHAKEDNDAEKGSQEKQERQETGNQKERDQKVNECPECGYKVECESGNPCNYCVACGAKLEQKTKEASLDHVIEPVVDVERIGSVDPADVRLVLFDEATQNPFWVLHLRGSPAAKIALADQPRAEEIRPFFTTEEYAGGLRQALIQFGPREVLAQVNARIYASAIHHGRLASEIRQEISASVTEQSRDSLLRLRGDLVDKIKFVIEGMNSNFIPGHLIKASLFDKLQKLGVHNPSQVIEDTFAENGEEFFNNVIDKAQEYMAMTPEALSEIKTAMHSVGIRAVEPIELPEYRKADAQDVPLDYFQRPGESFSQRLARTSVPLATGGLGGSGTTIKDKVRTAFGRRGTHY